MNILIIDNSIAFTGAFKCALNEADILSGEHRFVFVLSDQSRLRKTLEEKGYKVYQLPMVEIKKSIPVLLLYPLILLRNTLALQSILRHEKTDILQVNDFYNLLGVMAKLSGFRGKLITYVRFLPAVMPSFLRKTWIKCGLKYSHRMIAVSDAVLQQLPDNPRTIRIYDPVQLSENRPPKPINSANEIVVLYLSNYIKGKGQDTAVEAFAKAYDINKNLRMIFMGGDMGLEKNTAYRAGLEDRVQELGLSQVVRFAPFSPDVESAIKAADIVLNCSEAESFSMTCLEAAYYGTALIATRCGGPEEIIDDGQTGITVPVKDADAIANALLKLAGNETLRTEYAQKGKVYVTSKFNIEQYKKEMQQVITSS